MSQEWEDVIARVQQGVDALDAVDGLQDIMESLDELKAQIAIGESPFSTPGLADALRDSFHELRHFLKAHSEGLTALRNELRALRRTAPEYVRAERAANSRAERAERAAKEARESARLAIERAAPAESIAAIARSQADQARMAATVFDAARAAAEVQRRKAEDALHAIIAAPQSCDAAKRPVTVAFTDDLELDIQIGFAMATLIEHGVTCTGEEVIQMAAGERPIPLVAVPIEHRLAAIRDLLSRKG